MAPPHLDWILAGLTLAAPLLGGGSTLWAQATLALAIGLLFLWRPPERTLGPAANSAWILMLLLAGSAFLPADWWPATDWRHQLSAIPGVDLPSTRSPQPWLTFESFGLLVLAAAWTYYLLGHVWSRPGCMNALRIFCFGIVLLASVSVVTCITGYRVPFWPAAENSGINFGFFPNRNQTANVLAIGGIMINALAFDALRSRRTASAFWFASLGLICAALILAYSRSGIVLFFGGVVVWSLLSTRLSPSVQNAAVTVSGAILLLTVLFLYGGESLRRFQTESIVDQKNFRLMLQLDAANLATEAPGLGHGLGNFTPLFAMAREHSTMGNRVVHPESDWMWAAVELGWFAPLFILIMFVVALKKCLPLDHGTNPLLRCAAMLGAAGFICHGFIDVSGHRVGSLWPALLLLSLALHPKAPRENRLWVAPTFRALGCALVILSGFWLASYAYPLPTSAYFDRLVKQLATELEEDRPTEVIAIATRALRIAPLDWDLYHQRARAHAVLLSTTKAAADFDASRTLEPNWNDVCFEEGSFWLALGQPSRTVKAWQEALRRPSDDRLGLFRRMLDATRSKLELREILRSWSRQQPGYRLLFLETSSPLEFELESEQLLTDDPDLASLSSLERRHFFRMWMERRALADLALRMLDHPQWDAESWPYIARFHAEQGDYMRAYETVKSFATLPAAPTIESSLTVAQLEREFYVKSKDLVNGLTLLNAQIKGGLLDDAIATIRVLKETKTAPRYLSALEFDLQAKRKDWPRAWSAWLAYESSSR